MKASDFDSSEEDVAEEAPTPLHVSWLPLSPVYSSVFLGLCSLPGCRFKDVRRNLQKDIEKLKTYGTRDIFVFCTRGELLKYRVPNLIDAYQQHGICVHHHPIPDGDAPDIDKCCRILEELRSCLETAMVASDARVLLSDVLTPQQAIDSVRNLRGPGAIQTIKQYNFLHDFREKLAAHLAAKDTVLRSVSR